MVSNCEEVHQSCVLSLCLVNIYICTAHHVKCQADEAQAGIKIAGRYTSNLRYTDDTTLMAESEQEFKAS